MASFYAVLIIFGLLTLLWPAFPVCMQLKKIKTSEFDSLAYAKKDQVLSVVIELIPESSQK